MKTILNTLSSIASLVLLVLTVADFSWKGYGLTWCFMIGFLFVGTVTVFNILEATDNLPKSIYKQED